MLICKGNKSLHQQSGSLNVKIKGKLTNLGPEKLCTIHL